MRHHPQTAAANPGLMVIANRRDQDGLEPKSSRALSLEAVIHELRLRAGAMERPDAAPDVRSMANRLSSVNSRVSCLIDLAKELGHLHDRGHVHGDVKPANVEFEAGGRPTLVRGLAVMESDDQILASCLVGTASYLASEQVSLHRSGADRFSDQFSLAIVAYELLSLRHPFLRGTRARTLDAVQRARPIPLCSWTRAIPASLGRIVHRGFAHDPAKRYPSMGAMVRDLLAVF
jgi:serine/threonine protein kinase